jgi:hypothetical protein
VLLNGGPGLGGGRGRGATAAQTPGATAPPAAMLAALDKMNRRYAPYAPAMQPVPGESTSPPSGPPPDYLAALHAPIAFINGGPKDLAYNSAVSGFEAVQKVIALHAWQDVGHYPATFRQPNGGAFAVAVNAWLDWHLKGDRAASQMFVGPACGLCKDNKWNIQMKNVASDTGQPIRRP